MSVKKKPPARQLARVKLESPDTTQGAAERKSAEADLRALIEKFTPDRSKLVAAMRKSLRKRLPAAHEVVYEYRDCFVISFSPSGHGYEGVLAIRGSADAVRLYFNQGKELPDPERLLKGTSRARFIEVEGASALARPAVARLIDDALARNPVPFAKTGNGSVVIRSKPVKQSRHRSSANKKKETK